MAESWLAPYVTHNFPFRRQHLNHQNHTLRQLKCPTLTSSFSLPFRNQKPIPLLNVTASACAFPFPRRWPSFAIYVLDPDVPQPLQSSPGMVFWRDTLVHGHNSPLVSIHELVFGSLEAAMLH